MKVDKKGKLSLSSLNKDELKERYLLNKNEIKERYLLR